MLAFATPSLLCAESVLSPPQIANGKVVWTAYEVTDSIGPGEIYLYDIASGITERLTDNDLDDSSPRISDESIVWVHTDEAGNETLMIHDLSTGNTSAAPDDFVWEEGPQNDGDLTVFARHDGNDTEIVIQSTSLKTDEQLTDNAVEDTYPSISANNIAWVRGEAGGSEILLMSESRGGVEMQVTDNDYEDSFSQIQGDYLVWQGYVGEDWEIFLYNVSTGGDSIQVTENIYDDISPQTDGDHVAWLGYSHSGGEIFTYDVSSNSVTQITNNVSNNVVVNSGFESGVLVPWWGCTLQENCFLDDTVSRSGSGSLKVTAEAQTHSMVCQAVPVIGGETYDVEVWIKTDSVTPAGAQVSIDWAGGGEWGANLITGTNEDWQYSGVSGFQVPGHVTAVTVCLHLIQGSTGTAWFDDVVLETEADPLMETVLVAPNYAGTILPGSPSPEITLDVTLNPEIYGWTLSQLELRATLEDEFGTPVAQENFKPVPSSNFSFDMDVADSTPNGDYQLGIELYSGGNLVAQHIYPIRKLADASSYIDSDNRFILDGEPFFPIGLYVAQCTTEPGHWLQLDDIADSSFDTLMSYGTNTCGEAVASDEDIQAYLDAVESKGLNLIFSLWDYFTNCEETSSLSEATINTITHKVNTFKDHPAIISWYFNDERGLNCLPELEAGYEKIRELDDNHPVWSVHWNKDWVQPEAHTTDVVGVDAYPIPGLPITFVAEMADAAQATGKPFWLVPQIFEKQGVAPTREEMRAMTYLATNHGAKGLIYYSYFNLLVEPGGDTRWEQIKPIAGEIDALRPVLLSLDQTNENDIQCSSSDMDFKLMRQGDACHLFAVNTQNHNVNGVSFTNNMANKPSVINILFELDRQKLITDNGNFLDDFDPYEVHVYAWTKPGDLDCNGDVELADAIIALQIIAGLSPLDTSSLCFSADANADGKFGFVDLLYVLQYIASMRQH